MGRPLRVLFVEDQETDVELLVLELRRGGYDVTRERVDTPEGFAAALERQEWDIVLCDYRMPHFSAPAALAMVKEKDVNLPFIVVSGTIGEEAIVETLRAGAHDFMTKNRLSRLLPAIERELREAAMRAERKLLRQLQLQGQKMEAIGQFAGGIAHDFNNILTVISGYVGLALGRLSDEDPLRPMLQEVHRAGERAGTLVRRILAFSRQQIIDPRAFDLNVVVAGMDNLLRRVIRADIDFVTVLGKDLGRIRADPGQVEQVLMNLVVNARDAMPSGGRLIVRTANLDLPADDARCISGLQPGPQVLLSVTDTGTGMDERTRARIFEPFFTTKAEGKGTGLGLATVFAIVEQSGGRIHVESAPGHGTTFWICFPRVGEEAETSTKPEAPEPVFGGSETLLVVEDDDPIRGLAVLVLREHGYRVLEARDAAGALAVMRGEMDAIDLLVTDVVLPGMSGSELAECLSSLRPRTRVLFISGYTAGSAGLTRIPGEGVRFLPKPFTPEALLRGIREILDVPVPVEAA